MVRLLALVAPLALDTFAVSAALAASGLTSANRVRVSLVFPAFEMAMPVVGLLIGHALGRALGSVADYVAIALLVGVGLLMLRDGDDDPGRLIDARGLAVLALGVSISLDELAIGFGVGLLRLPLILLVTLIAVQAFFAAQLGMRLGSRIAEKARGAAEKFAGGLLVVAAGLVVVEKLLS